jgi:hypothetical protein
MTPSAFHSALDKLGLSRLGAAEWLDVDERTASCLDTAERAST